MSGRTVNELSLFTGAGGGVLGSKLLGWETIGYVEWDKYCQRVIAARIADGHLPAAPIFGDVREFVQSGAAAEYRGIADVVSGGFPCQPFSTAGKRAGADDPRNMWPATLDVLDAVRPTWAFLENVPGLLSSGYFGVILADLHAVGYDCRWGVVSAAAVGAPHLRKRLWIVATNADSAERRGNGAQRETHQRDTQPARNGQPGHVAYSKSEREPQFEGGASRREGQRSEAVWPESGAGGRGTCGSAAARTEPYRRTASEVSQTVQPADRHGNERNPVWWEVEPNVGRVVDGVAARVDRLRALGNGQVPAVAAAAWLMLTGDL